MIFTFIYAIIMLNTDLYNKTIIEHMTLDKFIKQCEKINDGANFPQEYLTEVYNDIKKEELKTLVSKDLIYEENIPYG